MQSWFKEACLHHKLATELASIIYMVLVWLAWKIYYKGYYEILYCVFRVLLRPEYVCQGWKPFKEVILWRSESDVCVLIESQEFWWWQNHGMEIHWGKLQKQNSVSPTKDYGYSRDQSWRSVATHALWSPDESSMSLRCSAWSPGFGDFQRLVDSGSGKGTWIQGFHLKIPYEQNCWNLREEK